MCVCVCVSSSGDVPTLIIKNVLQCYLISCCPTNHPTSVSCLMMEQILSIITERDINSLANGIIGTRSLRDEVTPIYHRVSGEREELTDVWRYFPHY